MANVLAFGPIYTLKFRTVAETGGYLFARSPSDGGSDILSLKVRGARDGVDMQYQSGGSSASKSVGWDFMTLSDNRFHFVTLSVRADSVSLAVDGVDLGSVNLVDGPVADCSSSAGTCNTYIQQNEVNTEAMAGCVLSATVTRNVNVNA